MSPGGGVNQTFRTSGVTELRQAEPPHCVAVSWPGPGLGPAPLGSLAIGMIASPRTRLGPLLLAAFLVAAASVGATFTSGADHSASDRFEVTVASGARTDAPRHEVRDSLEANEPVATAALTNRTDDGPRLPSGRTLAVLFAASMALGVLTAVRRGSSIPSTARRPLAFDVRRRGPPLLIGS